MIRVLIGLFLVPLFGYAQLSEEQQKILRGISTYRSELLQTHSEDRIQLGALIERQKKSGISDEHLKQLALALAHANREYVRTQKIPPNLHTWLNRDSVLQQLSDQEIAIIIRNADLYDLMHENVLSTKYPYLVSPESRIYDELTFYDIRDMDVIAEIGAGNGEFSVILGTIYDSLHVFVNEISPGKVEYIGEKIERIQSFRPGTLFTPVLGTMTNPNLPDRSFDKIIIRRAFHHFSAPQEMLRQIADDLKPDGELLIFENVRLRDGKQQCHLSLKRRKIVRMIGRKFFTLSEIWYAGSETLFRFRKVSREK